MKNLKLSDFLLSKRVGTAVFEIGPRYHAMLMLESAPPILRPYFLEVQNAAAAKRPPMPRIKWEALR